MARLIRSRYEPIEVVGRGGQGEILRAIDRQHDRQVALKVRKVGSPDERGALLSEAKILLSLRPHRALPLVRDDFFVRDRYYLVMDWVDGENLQRVLELRGDPGLPVSAVLGYLEDAAGALDHLHAHHPPIVHGDVKPANLILTSEGRVMLVDFGISRHAGNGDNAVGTAGFTAPEVVAGTGEGPSVDIYGLGATTFALLTGAPPSGIQPAWEGLARASAAAAERGIRQALSSDPARRPSSATQLVERLRSWQDTALPTGIVTFLFTDIEGSTSLWEREPDHMKEALARHNEILAEIVEHHSGRLIQDRGEGDSTFSVFERSSDAVRCALDIQLRLAAESWSGNVSIRVRIGIHSGEAELQGGAYTGNATNLAARIRSLAKGGHILLSQATAGLVRGSCPADAALVDHGEHRLKGLAREEQVFELSHPDLRAEVALGSPEPVVGASTFLPRQPTTFVGRRAELDESAGLLAGARLLTLIGPGGAGKTRLAMELAHETADRFPDGVFFVDLSSLAEPRGVVRAVAAALGVLDPLLGAERKEGQSAVEEHLKGFLALKRALLLIDNCEHLQDECARLCAALLAACPMVSILATSREALRIGGERVYGVPGLSSPGAEADAESLARSDAVQLFVERAGGVRPGYRLAAEDVVPVVEICRRLDGLPLAIELVAARLPVLTITEILPRLDEALRGVSGGGRDTPERHRSLEAAIRWSHELLDEQERALFRQLAAFVGGATLDAIERVCVQSPTEAGGVLDTLQNLVEKSLVVVEQSDGSSRYRFLETVRRFAFDRLGESGERDEVGRRHRDYFQSLVAPALPGTNLDESVLPAVALERDNIRAAFRWSIDADEAEAALWMAIGQYWYWRLAGLSEEIQRWIDEAFTRGAVDSPLRANALLLIGGTASGRTQYARALAIWDECLALFRSSENQSGAGWTLLGSGRVHGLRGDRDRSDRLLREAISSLDAAGDAIGAQWARFNWAWIALSRGEEALAASICEQIMTLGRDTVAPEPVAAAQIIDGILEALRGDIDRARALWRDGLAGSMESAPERQWFLLFIAGAELRAGDPKRARELLRDSLQLAKRTGLLEPVLWSLELAAVFAQRDGALTEAARLLGTAQCLKRESGFVLECAVWAGPVLEARRAAEAILGADRAKRERSAGEQMPVSEAVDLALDGLERIQTLRTGANQPALFKLGETPFIGREGELNRLRRLSAEAAAGRGRLVLISGEPGIGKSRLAAQFARVVYNEGATVLYGRSDEETLTPYQPFVEALRQFVTMAPEDTLKTAVGLRGGDVARIVPELADRLPDLPEPLKGDPEGQRYRLFEGVAHFLRAVAASSPVLLVLDDLHWSDKPSLMMLKQLLRSTEGAPLFVLGTYRETDLSRTHPLSEMLADLRRDQMFERVTLAGLDETEVESLIRSWAESETPHAFVRAVHQETEGNPFFVHEVLRHLRETGVVPEAGGDWTHSISVEHMAIPEGIREVVGRRLSRLGDTSNRVLSVGSAIGRSFGLDIVERVSELPTEQVLEGVEEAMAAGLVDEDPLALDQYSFSHALVREALYQELTTSRRLRLHRRIGDAIEEVCASNPESCLAELAYHFVEAGPLGGSDKAIDYAERAGRHAMALFAHEEAANHFERALQAQSLVETPDERHKARLLLALGEAQSRAADARGKGSLIEAVECARLVGESEVIARAALLYAGASEWSSAITERTDDPQIALLEEAYSALPPDDSPLRARVLARLAVAVYWSEARERAAPLSLEAIEIAHRVGDTTAVLAALEARRYALYRPEDTDERIADAKEALRLARETGDREAEARSHRWLIAEQLELGDVAMVDREIEEHARLAAILRQPLYDCYTTIFRATRAIMSGRFREGGELARAAQVIGQQERQVEADHMFAGQMAPMWRVQGTLVEMAPRLAEIVEEIPIPTARASLLMFMCDLGRVEEARGPFNQMAAKGFVDLPRDLTWLASVGFLSFVCAALSDAPRAMQLYELLLPYEGRVVTSGLALAAWGVTSHWLGMLAATMGRMEEAVRHFEAAIQMTKAMDARPLTAVTQCEYASALLGAGQRDRARPLLDEALATAEELEMKATVERLQSLRSRGLSE